MDGGDSGYDLEGGAFALRAPYGIGSTNVLETQVSHIAYYNTLSGNVQIANTGGVVIASIDGLTSSSTPGNTFISATSPITFAVNSTQAAITLQAIESGQTNYDNIVIADGVQVTALTGNAVFEAADRISFGAGSVITATQGDIILRSGVGDTDNDGSMLLAGTISAPAPGRSIALDLNGEQGAVQTATGAILASALRLRSNGNSDGSFALGTSLLNDVDLLAADASGAVSFRDLDQLTIDTIAASSGIPSMAGIATVNGVTEGAAVSVVTSGLLTVLQPIRTSPTAAAGSQNLGTVALQSLSSQLLISDNADISADGSVTLTAAGGIQTAGEVTTSNDDVSYASAVTLTDDVIIDTGSGSGSVTFFQTVNGSKDLTITAGTGDIKFNQPVGQSNRLNQLRLVSSRNATFDANVFAQNFLQNAGTGTTTFTGMLNTTLAQGVNLTGTNLRVSAGITTTGNGVVTVLLSGSSPNGVAVFDNGANINADGAVSITTSTRMTTGGDITTTNDNITVTTIGVQLSQSITVDSGPGSGNILFDSTVDGTTANSQTLTLDGGTAGTVTVTGAIGKSVSLRTLSLVDSNGAEFGTADEDLIIAGTQVRVINSQAGALVRFNGGVQTPQFNADAGPYQLQFAGSDTNIGTDSGGDYLSAVLLNTGMAIFGDGNNDILMFRNGLFVQAASSVELFGWIYTQASPVTLGDGNTPVNLRTHDSVIDTTAGNNPLYLQGDTITFGGVVEGGTAAASENVDLNAGNTGDIVFMDNVGGARRIGTMLVRNARNIVFPNVTAERLVQTTGTGTTTLRGIIDTNSTGTTHPGLSTNVGDIDSGTANPSLPTTLATRNVDLGVDIATVNIFVDSNVNTVAGGVRLQATKGTGGIVTLNNNGIINSDLDVILEGNATSSPAIVVNALATGRLGGPGEDVLVGTRRRFLTTSDADVEFRGNVSMVAGPGQWHADIFFVDTGSGAGTITFTGTVDMNLSDLDVRSGQGNINFRKAVTEVHRLFVQDDNDGTLTGPAPTTVTFVENLSTELLITAPGAYNVDLLGSRSIINLNQIQYYLPNCTTFRNTGRVTLGNESTDIVSVMFGLSTCACSGDQHRRNRGTDSRHVRNCIPRNRTQPGDAHTRRHNNAAAEQHGVAGFSDGQYVRA
ncbi:MAG UNVERIFIED_CONTAM: hypothetical protein LVR18_47180 [Planctomycetaceae bacterium]